MDPYHPPVAVTAEDIERAESDDRDMPRLRELLTSATVFDADAASRTHP